VSRRKAALAVAAVLAAAAVVWMLAPARPKAAAKDGHTVYPAKKVLLISIDCLSEREFAEVTAADSGVAVPGLRRLIQDGVWYRFAHAQSPWTAPSHTSMLTGLYPRQNGRDVSYTAMFDRNERASIVPAFRSIADAARSAGIPAHAVTGKGSVSARFGPGQGFQTYSEHARDAFQEIRGSPYDHLSSDVRGVWADARKILEGHRGKRLFAFLHTYDFHDGPGEHPARDWETGHLDREHFKILEWIDRELVQKVIVLTGDHGSNILRKDRKLVHRGLGHYEENLNVPIVLKLPGQARAGATSDALARHLDLSPTILEALGVPFADYRGDGRSLLAVLERGARRGEASFSENDGHTYRRYGLVYEGFKYIRNDDSDRALVDLQNPKFALVLGKPEALRQRYVYPPHGEELYDIAADPWEVKDLVADPAHVRVLAAVRAQMNRILRYGPLYTEKGARPAPTPDPEILKSLRALGYIN
jgi:arylsulfatase A-like enzyme